jgi:hypothetical protein
MFHEEFRYYEMCKKSSIQNNWAIAKGDRAVIENFPHNIVIVDKINKDEIFVSNSYPYGDVQKKDFLIWIPWQWQLQEFLFDWDFFKDMCIVWTSKQLSEFALNYGIERKFRTFDQLWLGAVMKTIWNKEWDLNKKDWILNNDKT